MYNVYHGSWRDFGTAVGAIVCTEMNTMFGATFVGRWFVDVLSANCSRETVSGEMLTGKCLWGNVLFASLTRHTLVADAPSQTVPCQGKAERFVFATNGAIERFGNLVRQELMNVWRDSILFASLTRHTIVANATIKTVPCHGKSGCLRLRSN